MNNSMNGPRCEVVRIIDGKRYNTRTAKWVMHIPCHRYGDDFEWENTDVYVSQRGQWFLAGRGNAYSRWGEDRADGSYPGWGIKLLTKCEAKALLEKHGGPYQAHFEVEEG